MFVSLPNLANIDEITGFFYIVMSDGAGKCGGSKVGLFLLYKLNFIFVLFY
jgi:hypothetical protein